MGKRAGDPAWVRLLPARLRRKLTGRSSLFAVVHNSGWLLFDRGVRLVIGMLVGIWVTRYLGPAQFGELAYALAWIAFLQIVTGLGVDGIVVRDISRHSDDTGQVLGTVFMLRLATGIASWLLAVAGMAVVNGWQDRSVWLIALAGGSLVFQAADTIDLWFQSQSQSRRTVLARLVAYLLTNMVRVLLILAQAPLTAFAAMLALDALAAALALRVAYMRFPSPQPWQHTLARSRTLLREALPFLASGLAVTIYMRIDQIMIKEMLGETELGLYAAMLPFSSLWHVIPMTLLVSVAPYVARKHLEGEEAFHGLLLLIFRVSLVSSCVIALGVALAADLIVALAYGPEYRGAAAVLRVHVFTCIPVFLGVAQSLWLLNEKKGYLNLSKTLLGAVASVVLNLVLIPPFGLMGAAVSAIIAYSLSAVFFNLLVAPEVFWMQLGIRTR